MYSIKCIILLNKLIITKDKTQCYVTQFKIKHKYCAYDAYDQDNVYILQNKVYIINVLP